MRLLPHHRRGIDNLVVVHVEVHHFDAGVRVRDLYSGVVEKRFARFFPAGDIAAGYDSRGAFEC